MSALVRVTRDGGRLRVSLNRPEVRNALSGELLAGLGAALEDAAGDPSVRVVILAGEGQDFCAGADLTDMKRLGAATAEENRADAERLGRVFRAIHAFPRPVVARVQGRVFGGGVGLVAASDLAICTSEVRFAFSEVRLGILPAVIGPYVLARIGEAATRRLFLTGAPFGAEAAVAMGLCARSVEPADLDPAVDAVVSDLLKGSPDAQRRIKVLLDTLAPLGLDDAAARTPAFIAEARASAEGQEGLRAFFEKRRASWVPGDDS